MARGKRGLFGLAFSMGLSAFGFGFCKPLVEFRLGDGQRLAHGVLETLKWFRLIIHALGFALKIVCFFLAEFFD